MNAPRTRRYLSFVLLPALVVLSGYPPDAGIDASRGLLGISTPEGNSLHVPHGAPGMRRGRNGEKQLPLYLPGKSNSVRFAVIGDSGTGTRKQYDVAEQMAAYRQEFPFDFVAMLGDNIYGGRGAADFQAKFE